MSDKDYGLPSFVNYGSLQRQPPNTNLTAQTNYVFMLPKVPNSVYFCTSVTVPGMACPSISIKTGRGLPVKTPSSEVTHGDLVFTYLINEDMSNYDELMTWFRTMTAFRDFSNLANTANFMSEEGQLMILSNKKNPLAKFHFRGLFPSNLSGVTFNSADPEANSLIATCTMQFTYYNIESLV